MGLWDVYVNPENMSMETVPLRGAPFSTNVVGFVDSGNPINLILDNIVVDYPGDNTHVNLDVGLRHPFPGLGMYTGFDVMGVFMGDAGGTIPGTSPGIQDDTVQRVNNPDGFTRWFNCPEFKSAGESLALLGFTPGKLGTPGFAPGAELNPYKYFCDGLDKDGSAFAYLFAHPDDRGKFSPGSTNYCNYDLTFPGTNNIIFQYAVVAH